jgi:hypothetical protein
VQYLIYPMAFLLIVDFKSGLEWMLVAGTFTCLVYGYFWTGGWPAYSFFGRHFGPVEQGVGLIAWFLLGRWFFSLAARGMRRPVAEVAAG